MKTRWTVRLSDIVSRRLITLGGIATIISVSLVFVVLAGVALPLFFSSTVSNQEQKEVSWWSGENPPLHLAIDEYRTMGWVLYADGTLETFRYDTGQTIEQRQLFTENSDGDGNNDVKITAVSTTVRQPDVALGCDDGTVRVGRIGFRPEIKEMSGVLDVLDQRELSPDEEAKIKSALDELTPGEMTTFGNEIVQRTPIGQYMIQKVVSDMRPAVSVAATPIRLLDHVAPEQSDDAAAALGKQEILLAFQAEQDPSGTERLQYCKLVEKVNQFTGEKKLEAEATDLPFEPKGKDRPAWLLLSPGGDNVLLVWPAGRLVRYDTRQLKRVTIVEEVDLVRDPAAELTICQYILGRETILCGDTKGKLTAWFRTRRSDPAIGDGYEMSLVHDLHQAGAPAVSVGLSERERLVAVGYDDGMLRVFHVTTEKMLLEQKIADERLLNVVMTPKNDGLVGVTSAGMWRADFDARHPDATLGSLFLPVWYEGYSEPQSLWQSSFASVEPEKKFGLWPLIFGTLKATFYAMLFGAPLALMAAIYTSEFLHPAWRMKIKPFVEMMASLPSVVLGFLAAFLFAPYIKQVVPAALACFATVPACYMLAAFLWQLLPHRATLALQRCRFLFLLIPLPAGLFLAYLTVGPLMEAWLFNGDIKRWLDDRSFGNGIGAWMMLFVPLAALAVATLMILNVNPRLRTIAARTTRGGFAAVNLLKFIIGACLTVLAALAVSALLHAAGADPRGSFVGTYSESNALVVGFVMGFAIIPIIYTLADDALNIVPNHLRSASLACGATPWQTAIRVVIPTAMSGLFSALMIGLGRAVGETMIVLMAGGNTPVTEWNIFSGFRTLAANVAFELPEAAEGDTHYRTLFLAALVLFMMTFFINTAAEVVRLRFRKRAYQL